MLKKLRSYYGYELVTLTDIAERFQISPATVAKITYAPDSTFPMPREGRGKQRVWQWYEVLDWYMSHRILRGESGSHIPRLENRYRNHNRAYRRAG